MGSGVYRLFLAALVVLEHTGFGMFGGFAVYSFFIMSGFWIAQMWQSKYSTMPAPYAAFLISRIWRLYPAFLITAIAAATVFARYNQNTFIFFTAAFTENALLPQTWSMSYEVQFYVMAPIFIAAFTLPTLWAVAFTLTVAAGYLMLAPNLLGIICLMFFLLGIAGATHQFRPRVLTAALSAAAGVLLVTTILALPALRGALIRIPDPDPTRYIIGLGVFRISYATLANATLAFVLSGFTLWTLTLKSKWFDRALGDISYTLYLAHYPVMFYYFDPLSRWSTSAVLGLLLWAAIMPSEFARKWFLRNWGAWWARPVTP